MPSKNQKAGDNATQIQAGLIQIGIDEKRVREIIKEENQLALKEKSIIAEETALKRLDEYTNVLVPKLVKAEMLEAFTDPSIQILFKQSEKTAFCTDREKDYEILSELLIHRIKRNGNYTTSAAIEKAINEVNNLSEDALLGLTLYFSIETYTPVTGDVRKGLSILDNLYGKIIKDTTINLNDESWIENLEITNSIKINLFSTSKKLDDYYFSAFNGYACLGIKKDSENYNKALEILRSNNLPLNILTENILDNNYVRIDKLNLNDFKNINLPLQGSLNLKLDLNEKQEEALKQITALYEQNGSIKERFIELLNSYKYIHAVICWWNNNMLKKSFTITPIGKVIAHTNAKSIDNSLPDLN